MYVVFSALLGGQHDFIGGTAGFDPIGRLLGRVESGEGLVVTEIDPSVGAAVREDQRMGQDRRTDPGERVTSTY